MTRPVVPLRNLNRRLPESGRIRLGVRTGRAMKALEVFRFTSPDRDALDQVAATYGGTVAPWNEPKADPNQSEVITTSNELNIVLPPDPLGGSPVYERWGGGGCDRRCDGEVCTITTQGPDGPEYSDVACRCVSEGAMSCDPHTRLNVILPEVRFTGTWRMETKGWNAAQEMPGMVELIQSMQERGMTRGVLRLEKRRQTIAGKTNNFVVPVLGLAASMEQLASGAAQVGALGPITNGPAALELTEGEGPSSSAGTDGQAPSAEPPPPPSLDDEVVEAEVVEDVPTLADLLPEGVRPNMALRWARLESDRFHLDAPEALDQVTDERVIEAVLLKVAP